MSVYDGPKLITNGLVFLFDAADKNCYRGTGTGCRDLITNTVGTLTNFGVQSFFSTANGGNIIFDGTNDYINFGDKFDQAGSWTVGAIAKTNTPASVDVIIGRTSGDANYYQNYVVYFYNNKYR